MKSLLLRAVAIELVLIAMAFSAAHAQREQAALTALRTEELRNIDVASTLKESRRSPSAGSHPGDRAAGVTYPDHCQGSAQLDL